MRAAAHLASAVGAGASAVVGAGGAAPDDDDDDAAAPVAPAAPDESAGVPLQDLLTLCLL